MAIKSWVTGGTINSPFAEPSGLLGRLAGRFMFYTNRQDEVLSVLDVRPGEHVLEVGYGPGALIRLLGRTGAGRICGVDPSPDMREQAARRAGGADLRLGTASDTGFPDDSFDCVVTVNTVALWPDLGDGLRELRRVTRRGGRVVIAWHGGTDPGRIARSLRLPEDKLARIEEGLSELFDEVKRHELKSLTVFAARDGSAAG
ncbi:class I SAM-dependent methyltransferase [Nonomuraea basaltis]|uniref:class I SAM-dependent methyltransferase n=1 Tax=Nonomuraea basaltis TaxID=2495887 RepID=UPI00110C6FB5|nr:methyltransferase domain-containing protein [Nonomuraea basaltis]TMR98301.1 methyltransferase domain-containing protein [Nonomuraea basaltis]